jgi:hypothetical protein
MLLTRLYVRVGILFSSHVAEAKLILLTHIHDHSLPWFGTDTSIKSGTVKLFFQTKILAKWCGHASVIQTSFDQNVQLILKSYLSGICVCVFHLILYNQKGWSYMDYLSILKWGKYLSRTVLKFTIFTI